MSHGVAVLEAAAHLRVAGYAVEDAPHAVLASDDPWHARSEPDLALILNREIWPVEVQREVSERTLNKWDKSLKLAGRLALVLYNEEARQKQQFILQAALYKLPAGVVKLTSLEAMEGGGWAWEELATTGRATPD